MALGSTFLQVVDHVRTIEGIPRETYGGNDKRPRRQGTFSGSQSKGRGFSGSDYHQHLQPSRPVQEALQPMTS